MDRIDIGQLDIARSLLDRGLAVAMESLGPDHPDTLKTRDNSALWLGEGGRVNEALAHSQALLEDRRRILGPDHPDTLKTRNDLGWVLGEAGRVGEAVAHSQALLEDDLRVLGPDHRETLRTRHHLARWLGEAGKVDEAVAQFQALLEDDLRVLGPDHPETLGTRHNLAWFLATCPDPQFRNPLQAVALAKRAVERTQRVGSYWNTLGAAHYRADEHGASIAALEKSMKLRKGGDGFDWSDAGIGAGAMVGIVLVLMSGLALSRRRSGLAV